MARERTVEAQWMSRATDLSTDLASAAKMRTIEQISLSTGISIQTIRDDLTRGQIESDRLARAVLCRPAHRIDRTPLWTPEQEAEAVRRIEALRKTDGGGRRGGTASEGLPLVTYAQAVAAEMLSTYDIAKLARVHEQTVRKWDRGERLPKGVDGARLPAAVARRSYDPALTDEAGHRRTHGPVKVYDGTQVRDWLTLAGLLVAEPVG